MYFFCYDIAERQHEMDFDEVERGCKDKGETCIKPDQVSS